VEIRTRAAVEPPTESQPKPPLARAAQAAPIPQTPVQQPVKRPEPELPDVDSAKEDEQHRFDFHQDDSGELVFPVEDAVRANTEEWEVGEHEEPSEERSQGPDEILPSEPELDFGRTAPEPFRPPAEPSSISRVAFPQPAAEQPLPIDDVRVRSSGFFLTIFVMTLLAFGALSALIMTQPDASRQVFSLVPGIGEHLRSNDSVDKLVALENVHAEYRRLKDGQPALVVSGVARNSSPQPLHLIKVSVALLDSARRDLAHQAIYCGNVISSKIISEMTPREIEFFQRLDPPRSFSVKAGDSSPFLAVFLNPPHDPNLFTVRIAGAEPARPERSATSAP